MLHRVESVLCNRASLSDHDTFILEITKTQFSGEQAVHIVSNYDIKDVADSTWVSYE